MPSMVALGEWQIENSGRFLEDRLARDERQMCLSHATLHQYESSGSLLLRDIQRAASQWPSKPAIRG